MFSGWCQGTHKINVYRLEWDPLPWHHKGVILSFRFLFLTVVKLHFFHLKYYNFFLLIEISISRIKNKKELLTSIKIFCIQIFLENLSNKRIINIHEEPVLCILAKYVDKAILMMGILAICFMIIVIVVVMFLSSPRHLLWGHPCHLYFLA